MLQYPCMDLQLSRTLGTTFDQEIPCPISYFCFAGSLTSTGTRPRCTPVRPTIGMLVRQSETESSFLPSQHVSLLRHRQTDWPDVKSQLIHYFRVTAPRSSLATGSTDGTPTNEDPPTTGDGMKYLAPRRLRRCSLMLLGHRLFSSPASVLRC